MRMSNLLGKRIKEDPKDAVTVSHKFLLRGAYVRTVSAGIYSLLPLGLRVIKKIEAVIRDEMNRIGGQEVLLPVVLPKELWDESGRYESVGPELLRFRDRNNKEMLLGMTHEEAIVHLFRTEVDSYKQLPSMLYQIQTKYRDEARPRACLIRMREFTMKDAYSFHRTQKDLEEYYKKAHDAYVRIFERIGLKKTLSIESDSGMMGGSVAHEFMSVADCGEDTIFVSPDNRYRANREIAVADWKYNSGEEAEKLEKVHTPDRQTIEDVAEFLNIDIEHTGKTVCYIDGEKNLLLAMIRGDFEVNEAKLKKLVSSSVLDYADDETIRKFGAEPGYASPLDLNLDEIKVLIDNSAAKSANLLVGANEKDYHFKNFNAERDLNLDKCILGDIATVRAGDPCPLTGKPLLEKRGIELGNIFQLGKKYSEPMNCNYLDENGKVQTVIMGCYGIGVGRSMSAIIEESHDDYGPIWPLSISPYHVHICALNPKKDSVLEESERIYHKLSDMDLEVLLDDRGEKAGFMFSDADLIGVPYRIIVSPRNMKDNLAELKIRGEKESKKYPLSEIAELVFEMVKNELNKW